MDFNENIAPDKTPKELLAQFYKSYDLPADGGQSDSKVRIELFKGFHFYIPNFSARRKAVLKHDVHHLLTAYSGSMKGEAEISAWEIASGCKRYWAAWVLDMQGMALGFWFDLPGIYKAFIRGRYSRNLYSNAMPDELVLNTSVSELRQNLDIPAQNITPSPTLSDNISFLWNLFIGSIFSLASMVFLPFVVIYNMVIIIFLRKKK